MIYLRCRDHIGRPMAGADRPFDRRGQARRGPIAGEHQIGVGRSGAGPARVFVNRRGERRPLFLDDLPWRKRLFNLCHFCDFRPNGFGEFFARDIEEAIGTADRDRQPAGKRKQPFDGPVDDAQIEGRKIRWRGDFKMRIDDRAIVLGRLQARHEALRGIGRNRENDFVRRVELHQIVAEIEGGGVAVCKLYPPQPMVEPDLYPAFNEIIERGRDERGGEALRGDERTAGAPSPAKRFPHHGGGKVG